MERSVAYTDDLMQVAEQVFTETDLMATLAKAAEQVGWDNKFLLIRYYQETMISTCAATMIDRWGDQLSGMDVYAESYCDKALTCFRVD